jgi:enoyl-CoA hydratase/carnithine racemase
MMLSGAAISSEDALAAGLVDQVVPPEQLLEAAQHTALELAAGRVARRRSLQLGMHMQVRWWRVGLGCEGAHGFVLYCLHCCRSR